MKYNSNQNFRKRNWQRILENKMTKTSRIPDGIYPDLSYRDLVTILTKLWKINIKDL